MSEKGLIFSIQPADKPVVFMASQFVIGIWEYQVNRLDEDFVRDVEEYFPTLSQDAFNFPPQLRTIPVGKSIRADMNIMVYEQAESLVKAQKQFLVAPCICRREHHLKGGGCEKPTENCLVFGWGVDYYQLWFKPIRRPVSDVRFVWTAARWMPCRLGMVLSPLIPTAA